MPHPFFQRLASEAIRLVAASQAFAMVFAHTAWILMASLHWTQGGGDDVMATMGRQVLDAYKWLGGIGPDGRGDESGMMIVWSKLALAVYALDALMRARRGPRKPIAPWRLAFGSGVVVFAGTLFAFLPPGIDGDVVWLATVLGVIGTIGTFWAIGARRLGDALAHRFERGAPAPPAALDMPSRR